MPVYLGTRRSLVGSSGLTSPLALPGLELWLDFSDISTLFQDTGATTPITADGQIIKRANDKSGQGRNATEATNGPTYKTGIKNGRSIGRGDGTNDVLATASFSIAQPLTLFGVVITTSIATTLVWMSQIGATSALQAYVINNPFRQIAAGLGLNGGAATTNWEVWSAALNGASSLIRINGSQTGSGNAGANAFNSGVNIFANTGPANFWPGDIGELGLYSRLLSTPEFQQIEAYLNAKWAVY